MKKVVLITPGQPSVNPRIVKEADALAAAGYKVTVLYCYWIQWAHEADVRLLENVKWGYRRIGGTPNENKTLYYFTKARTKVNTALNKQFGNRLLFAERAQARCYDELLKVAKSIKADWYIGHNLGALSIAVKAASYHGASAGFDFEDYHREENEAVPRYELKRIIYLEGAYVPLLNYISTSSPLISEKVAKNFPTFPKPVITVLNCFPLSQMPAAGKDFNSEPSLKLFWFSQTVGKNRGLEQVIAALKKLNNVQIQLTLAGNLNSEMERYLNEQNVASIRFVGIIQPEELPAFAARFDVGLATEIRAPLNRDICLTNKIFTYLLAGNCILASDTAAQKEFMQNNQGIGLYYCATDEDDLAKKIKLLFNDRKALATYKLNSRLLAKTTMNWENESKKLIDILSAST